MSRLRRLWRFLASAKLAAILIAAIAGLSLLSVVVPQASYLTPSQMSGLKSSAPALMRVLDAVGLTHLFSSWLLAVPALLLAVNVTLCTVRRVIRAPKPVARFSSRSRLGRMADRLRSDGWTVLDAGDGQIRAVRGRSGFWGSIALHLGILVVVLGGAVAVFTSFNGTLTITEGQTVKDVAASYDRIVRVPRFGPAFTGDEIGLRSMQVLYKGGQRVVVRAMMSARRPGGVPIEREVGVNRPLDFDGNSYLLDKSGYAPSIVLDRNGAADFRVVRLARETPQGWRDTLQIDEVRKRAGRVTLTLIGTPVPLAAGATLPAEKLDLRDPRLAVRATDKLGVLAEATLAPGEGVELAPGVSLSFDEMVLWSRFMVRRSPSRFLVYAGFLLCVLGAAVRFAVPEKRLVARVGRKGLSVTVKEWPVPGGLGGSVQGLVTSLEQDLQEEETA